MCVADGESSFELIERVQAGDAVALNAVLERYRPRLRRWVSGRLGYARDMADTEDIVQDVLIGAFRSLHTFENRGEWARSRPATARLVLDRDDQHQLLLHDPEPVFCGASYALCRSGDSTCTTPPISA